jgi:Tfp pilus assembly protein PilW
MNMTPVHYNRHKNIKGFSLLELMIVMTILIVILSLLSAIVGSIQSSYAQQRPRTEAINNATAAMDTLVRLIRGSGNQLSTTGINPDPDGNGLYDSINIQSDWNPVNGAATDAFENITFTIRNGTTCTQCVLNKQEASDILPVPFLEDIGAITFTYYTSSNTLISNPVTNNSQIALVKITLTTKTPGLTPMTFTSTAHIRKQ